MKDKLNVTTIIRTRKDKIGKVNIYFKLFFKYSKIYIYLVNKYSNTRI
jgi:hypothetical protein